VNVVQPDLLLLHGRLVTPPPGGAPLGEAVPLMEVAEAAVAVKKGRIAAVGPTPEVLARVTVGVETRLLDLEGRAVLPGFVDPHTHLVWAGDRIDEMAMRRAGRTYLEILAAGGGILASVRALRAASDDELLASLLARLRHVVRHGTTTVEVKSGYGLSEADELRSLEVVAQAARKTGLALVPTLLGAHAWPPETPRADYLEALDRMAEAAAAKGLARFVDVFLEEGVFSAEEAERVLRGGLAAGLRPKVHADEIAPSRGAETAARLGAVSADHLTKATDEGLAALAAAGTVAVLLPGTSFFLGLPPFPAERARRHRLVAAVATDANPGSSPTLSMPMAMALLVHAGGFTPEEALLMATANAARAIGEENAAGSLAEGMRADIVVLDARDWRALVYHFGTNLVHTVVAGGRILVQNGNDTEAMAEWRHS
jgi:imidazolonepropionase